MRDCRPLELLPREALELDTLPEGEVVGEPHYIVLRREGYCGFCARFHEIGDMMVIARIRDGLRGGAPEGRYCCDCSADIQREAGGIVPRNWPASGFDGSKAQGAAIHTNGRYSQGGYR